MCQSVKSVAKLEKNFNILNPQLQKEKLARDKFANVTEIVITSIFLSRFIFLLRQKFFC